MSAAGLWPREEPRPTRSEAERCVWRALQSGLPAGWHAWHSLRIRDGRNIDGEGDFVLAVPARGMLVLEVKGGRVEVRDGRWLQNGRPMETPPREQALGFARRLVERLRATDSMPPAWGVATCFPDTEFGRGPSQGDVEGCVLGAQDLPFVGEALVAIVERALPLPHAERDRWTDALHALWGETWIPKPCLGQRVRASEEERVRLDAEQVALLDLVEENRTLLVDGGAGTGKTLCAVEAARQAASSPPLRVLLCTFLC